MTCPHGIDAEVGSLFSIHRLSESTIVIHFIYSNPETEEEPCSGVWLTCDTARDLTWALACEISREYVDPADPRADTP